MPNQESDRGKCVIRAPYDGDLQCYSWDKNEGVAEGNAPKRLFFLCNRLDSPTSGVLVGAGNSRVAGLIRELFRDRKTHKTYWAVVAGLVRESRGEWRDRISRERKGARVSVSADGDGLVSVTRWTVISRRVHPFPMTLLKLEPLTGRTHQLRVQCGLRRHGILGDRNYGEFGLNKRAKQELGVTRLCLHAQRIAFELNMGRERIRVDVESPVPEIFERLFPKG